MSGGSQPSLTLPARMEGVAHHQSQHVAAVVDKLATIVNANTELEKYHRTRRQTLGVPA